MGCEHTNVSVAELTESRHRIIDSQITRFIGPYLSGQTKEIKDEHKRLYDTLRKHMRSWPDWTDGNMQSNDFLSGVRYFIDKKLGNGSFSPAILTKNLASLKSVNFHVNRMLRIIDKQSFNKKISARKFPDIIATYADKYGILSRFIRNTMEYSDTKLGVFSNQTSLFKVAKNRFAKSIADIIRRQSIDNSMLLDGIDSYLGEPIRDKNNNPVTITDIVGKTHVRINGKREKIPIGEIKIANIYLKDNIGRLEKAILEKHEFFVNDLQNGEVRYVVPRNFADASNADIDKVKYMLAENRIRRAQYKEKMGQDKEAKLPYLTDVNTRDYNYKFVMVKQGEGSPTGEKYHAYIVSRTDNVTGKTINYLQNPESFSDVDATKVISEGMWKAGKHRGFGSIINKEGQPIANSHMKDYTDFSIMSTQPNAEIMPAVWEMLSELRSIYNRKDKNSVTSIQVNLLKSQNERLEKLYETLKKQFNKDTFQKLLNLNQLKDRIWYDEDGNLQSVNSEFYLKNENYSPNIYPDETYRKMLESAINRMQEKTSQIEDEQERAQWIQKIKQMSMILEAKEADVPLNTNYEDVYTKHRRPFTNPMLRRRDMGIHDRYMSGVATALAKNELMINLLESVLKVKQAFDAEKAQRYIDFMIDRFKLAIGDPTYNAKFLGIDVSNKRVRDVIENTLGVILTERQIDKLSKYITGEFSIYALNMLPALTNRGQIVSPIAMFGLDTMKEAEDAIETNPEMWRDIVDKTGVTNILTQLSDVMFAGGSEVEFEYEGRNKLTKIASAIGYSMVSFPFQLAKTLVTGGSFASIPLNLNWSSFPFRSTKEFIQLLGMGRKGFIKAIAEEKDTTSQTLSVLLQHYENNRMEELPPKLRKAKEYIEKIKERKISVEKRRSLDELSGLFWDIFAGTKEPEKIIGRIHKLLSDAKDDIARTRITWKLSSIPIPAKKAKEWLTFTGSEEAMRVKTAISAILHAERMGLLPGKTEEERYTSNQAKMYARLGVYTYLFGMSQSFMPEMFTGFGRVPMQFKGYPLQESRLELDMWHAMYSGDKNQSLNAMKRAMKAMRHLTFKVNGGTFDAKAEVPMEERDFQAERFVTMAFNRGMATMAVSLISTFFPFSRFVRRNFATILPTVFGLESPILGVPTRLLMRILFWGLLGSDDDDLLPKAKSQLEEFGRLILPPWIMLALSYLADYAVKD